MNDPGRWHRDASGMGRHVHPHSLFEPGSNCYAVGHAHRVAMLVDGEAYFNAFVRAAERATRSLSVLAWDFNSTTRLHFNSRTWRGPPDQLGDFLNWIARRRRDLRIRILDWDYPLIFGTDREIPPGWGFSWKPHRQVRIAYDNTHPVSGSHHQKVVVIDDAMAFVGGFDLTACRWDTPEHAPDDVRRVADGKPYPPFHDLMMAVDGEAAKVLGQVFRDRWATATGQVLDAPASVQHDPWPPSLTVDLNEIDVAIARTMPPIGDTPAVREVEQLYLDMIASAKRLIYIENQYFTSKTIADALAARLAEPDGPEIIAVLRLLSHGWLEENTMHRLRTEIIAQLRAADRHGRFHPYYAHVDCLKEGTCIDMHAKLMIVDDEILRIGSANLCNRSMGLDSECDAAVQALGQPAAASAIRTFRNRLLGEHLDADPARVHAEATQRGSVHAAIAALAGKPRTLKAFNDLEESPGVVLELARIADPEGPLAFEKLIEFSAASEAASGSFLQRNPVVWKLAGLILLLLGLTALWRYTPLSEWLDADQMAAWAHQFASHWWAPFVVLLAYTPASVVMFPRPLITLAATVAFGPVLGCIYALSGILLAAWASYVAGRRLPHHTVRHLVGRRLARIAAVLRRRGLSMVIALRLVPVAPFFVEGIVAGAIGIKRWHFLLGTLIGMLPGTLTTTVFGNEISAALRDPSRIRYGLVAAVVLGMIALTFMVHRWVKAWEKEDTGAQGELRQRAC